MASPPQQEVVVQATTARKTVAVTGGGSGIGAATVALLAAQDCTVIVLDVAAGEPPLPDGVAYIPVDVSDEAKVQAAFAEIGRRYQRLDGLVNSAGVESSRLLQSTDGAGWDRVMEINLKGTMLCTREAAALMRPRGGAVVNVASIAGKRMSYSGDAAYTASKGAVLAFTRHAAFELAIDRIRVTAVCPGPTLTPMITRNLTPEQIENVATLVPLGRWVKASDVAQAIVFLLGDGAAMCTGTSIDIDGGMLVSNGARYEDYFSNRF